MSVAGTIVQIWSSARLFLLYSWPFLLLIMLWVNKVRWRKYPIEAVILEKRGDNLVKTNDRTGRFFDKFSDMTFYKFKKSGDTIQVYNFDWMLHNVSVPTNLMERYINLMQGNSGTIFLFRYGSKQYKPIDIRMNKGVKKKFVEVKDKKGKSVYSYQYVQFDPRKLMGTIDFEVVDWDNMNFMVQEQRATVERRKRKNEWMKQMIIPLAIIAGSVLVALFILKFSFDAGHDLRGGAAQPQQSNDDALAGSKVGGVLGGIVSPGE